MITYQVFSPIYLGEDRLKEAVWDQANVLDSYRGVSRASQIRHRQRRLTPDITHGLLLRQLQKGRHRHLGRSTEVYIGGMYLDVNDMEGG